jgi:hypothetical protein
MMVRYAVEELGRRAASLREFPAEPPEFPVDAGDPLASAYGMVRALQLETAARIQTGRDKPEDFSTGAALLAMKPYPVLVATIRWCAWIQALGPLYPAQQWPTAGMRCLHRLAARVAKGGAGLDSDELDGFFDYLGAYERRLHFPSAELVSALEHAMRAAVQPDAGAGERVLDQLIAEVPHFNVNIYPPATTRGQLAIFSLDAVQLRGLLRKVRDRVVALWDSTRGYWKSCDGGGNDFDYRQVMMFLSVMCEHLKRSEGWSSQDVEEWIDFTGARAARWNRNQLTSGLLLCIERGGIEGVTPRVAEWLGSAIERELAEPKPDLKWVARARALLGIESSLVIERGEVWSDELLTNLEGMKEQSRAQWIAVLTHAQGGTSSAPSRGWLKIAESLCTGVEFKVLVLRWFELADRPREAHVHSFAEHERHLAHVIRDPHMDLLRGLCWMCSTLRDAEVARALGKLAVSCYRKVPGIGPRAVRVGNAAVWALGRMPGMDALGQLAVLRVKVKSGSAQKGIEKALAAAAEREGLPREEIEELGVPSYGLTEVGRRMERLGEFEVELDALEGEAGLRFFKVANGNRKEVKSAPAALRAEHGEELKELKAAVKDVAAMLGAQRDRIDPLFLENKSWGAAAWRERYLNHPLVGVAARRLIWSVEGAGRISSVTWLDGGLVGAGGKRAEISEGARVRLWHPIEASQDEVLTWRGSLRCGRSSSRSSRRTARCTCSRMRSGTRGRIQTGSRRTSSGSISFRRWRRGGGGKARSD